MNCKKFENRVQQLLDDRASLALDLSIQSHANECDECRSALTVYEQFSELGRRESDLEPILLASNATVASERHSQTAGQPFRSQQNRKRLRIMATAAALVFVCSVLISRPGNSPSALAPNPPVIPELAPSIGDQNVDAQQFVFSGIWEEQWNGLWEYVPSDLTSLTSYEYLDMSSLGSINLASLVPEDHIRVVRGLPATWETMEPIYRVSTELPVLQQWSNGIHCTLGLIQTSLPSKDKPLVVPSANDLGNRPILDRRNIC